MLHSVEWSRRGPMQNLGADPSEQWFYDVIVLSHPWYDFLMKMF